MEIKIKKLLWAIIFGILSQSAYAQTGAQIGLADQQKRVDGFAALKKISEKAQADCASPELAAYYQKSPCLSRNATPEQLSDSTKITSEQKQVMNKVRQKVLIANQERVRIFRELGSDKDKRDADLFESTALPKNEKNDLNLYEGKITWGQYNRERIAISEEYAEDRKKL